MKPLHKVRPIEVKRAFVASEKMLSSRKKNRRYLPKFTQSSFLNKLQQAKTATNKLTEKQLDKIIADKYKKRADAYNNTDWYRATVPTSELGVWRTAGGLPSQWTCCSVSKIALKVKEGLKRKSKFIRARSKRAIPRIMEFADIINKEKYLFPIVFAGGTGPREGKRCRKKMKGDIDDGCMRSIALAIAGRKTLNVYFGKPKSKTTLNPK